MVVDEGSNVSLRCMARGSPEPSITWKRENGQPIYLDNGENGWFAVFINFLSFLDCLLLHVFAAIGGNACVII